MKKNSQVFISVLIVLAIVLALGSGLIFYSRSLRDTSRLQVDTDKAYALARSGVGLAESFRAQDLCCRMDPTTYNLGEGTVRIRINSTLYDVLRGYRVSGEINSVGEADRSTRLLQKTFDSPVTGWAKTYGGTTIDYLQFYRPTSDGGYLLGGELSGANMDLHLIKINSLGTASWRKRYNNNLRDELVALQQTADSGYILGGNTRPDASGVYDFLVIKTDSQGRVGAAATGVTWPKTYGSTIATVSDILRTLQQTGDGGYILGGTSSNVVLVIKTDSQGRVASVDPGAGGITWARTYSIVGGGNYYHISLQQTNDGGYIIGGDMFYEGRFCLFAIKTDRYGMVGGSAEGITWVNIYRGAGLNYDLGSIQEVSGGYILGGRAYGASDDESFIIKTSSQGNLDWARRYGGLGNNELSCFQQTNDGYILAGNLSTIVYGKFLAIKTDSQGRVGAGADAGVITWAKTYGSSVAAATYPLDILQQTSDDGYILGGESKFDGITYCCLLVVKINSLGKIDCCDICQDVSSALIINQLLITSPPAPSVNTAFFSLTYSNAALTVTDLSATFTSSLICPRQE